MPDSLADSDTGVFIGISNMDYGTLQYDDIDSVNAYTNAGGALSLAANRISYIFDFHGPSLAVETACSSSSVAIHLACQSIARGETSLALAGGANILVKPGPFVGFSKALMLSPRARCRAFDASGDGYVRSEGAGIVVLKPLEQALKDHDPIYGLIVATGVNSDGRTRGISLPSGQAQEDLLRAVYHDAGIPPGDVYYVEAHGTGTAVGDPIECVALGSLLGSGRDEACRIGSVKSNIGHLEPAAGVAGLIKVALSLKHREIPPTLYFETPHPEIPFEKLKLQVQTETSPLPENGSDISMGVNSFGFGGTNAHIVVKEFVPAKKAVRKRTPKGAKLLLISSRSPHGLTDLAGAYQEQLLTTKESSSLDDICFTAALRRSHHDHRLAVVGRNKKEMAEKLEAFMGEETRPSLMAGQRLHDSPSKAIFIFSGNGCQWWGMGRDLLKDEPVFRKTVESIDEALQQYTHWSILAELRASEADSRLDRTDVAQPVLFGIQVGLLELLSSWGIKPEFWKNTRVTSGTRSKDR